MKTQMITTYLEFTTVYVSSVKNSELNAKQFLFKQSTCLFPVIPFPVPGL